MAKKIKFALNMAEGAKARTLADLRAHFDLEHATAHFLSGKLQEWLTDRYYDAEGAAVARLEPKAVDFPQKLCEALGVPYEGAAKAVDIADLQRVQEKRALLRQMTEDEDIIVHAGETAFTQEDLADLLDDGVREIYLCGEAFTVPMRIENCRYIGILREPKISIDAASREELAEKGIHLTHVRLPEILREEPAPTATQPENKKLRQSYHVSTLLDHRLSDKDRAAAEKLYDAAQDILAPLVFDIDVGTKPLLSAAQDMISAITFDIDVGTRPLRDAAESFDLPAAWRTYLSRMA